MSIMQTLFFPSVLLQIDARVVFKRNAFGKQAIFLLREIRREAARMIDNPVAGIVAVIFGAAQYISYKARIFIPADEACDLPVSCDLAFGDFFNRRKNFVYQIFRYDFPQDEYSESTFNSRSTCSPVVAQLVAMRATVCASSAFSQKERPIFSESRA